MTDYRNKKDPLKNIEVEVKLKVKEISRVTQWLKDNNAEYLGEKNQIDIYFDPPHKTFIKVLSCGKKVAKEYLRIRKSDKGSSVTYKLIPKNLETNETQRQFKEIETFIKNHENMFELLSALGFKKTAIIDKNRKSWKYKEFLFEIDDVKEIGVFLEIEFRGNAENPNEAEKRLFNFLEEINIGEYELDNDGLVQLYWNKK